MQKMQKIGIIAISIALIFLIVFVVIYDTAIDKCVLKIDGTKYTVEDFNNYLTLLKFEQGNDIEVKSAYEQFITVKLYAQKAKEKGYTLSEEEVKTLEENYESENVDKEVLAQLGFEKEKYIEYYKEALLASSFMGAIGEYYPMTDAEYLASKAPYEDMLKTYNYRIMRTSPDVVEEGEEEPSAEEKKLASKTKAEAALEKIKAGEAFETVAEEYGTYRFIQTLKGEYTLANGQIESMPLLYLNSAITNETLYNELIELEPGEYTNIIEEEDGYIFAKLESVEEEPTEDAENKLKSDLNTIYAQQYVLSTTQIIRNSSKIKDLPADKIEIIQKMKEKQNSAEETSDEKTEDVVEDAEENVNSEIVEE